MENSAKASLSEGVLHSRRTIQSLNYLLRFPEYVAAKGRKGGPRHKRSPKRLLQSNPPNE